MRTLENKKASAQEILDTDPAVSMSIDLKDKLQPGEVIDVDYDALRTVLKETGAPQDNGDASLVIKGSSGLEVKGFHFPETKTTNITFNRDGRKMQKSVQHELKHHADFIENPSTKADVGKKKMRSLGVTGTRIAIASNMALASSSAVSGRPATKDMMSPSIMNNETYEAVANVIERSANTSILVTLGSLAILGVFYYGNKRERTAQKAEKLDLPQVISIDKPR